MARQARRVSVRLGAVRQGLAWCGTARQARAGIAWQGEERLGRAGEGGMTGQCLALRRHAWHGKAGRQR